MPRPTATRALDRGLRLLSLLAARPDGLAFSEVAASLRLGPSGANRLLASLEALGHARRSQAGRWCAGPALATLAGGGLEARLLSAGRPFLPVLRERCGNTALLIAWTGRHMVVLDRELHEDALPLQDPGRASDNLRQPPWGWFFAPLDALLALPGDPPARELKAAHAEAQRQGWACRIQADRRRLAAPIREAGGAVVGALAIGGTPASLPDGRLAACAADLLACAASASRLLGG